MYWDRKLNASGCQCSSNKANPLGQPKASVLSVLPAGDLRRYTKKKQNNRKISFSLILVAVRKTIFNVRHISSLKTFLSKAIVL